MAVYKQKICEDYHLLVLENDDGFVDYFDNGNRYYEFSAKTHRVPQPDDIVSKWEESIDEEKLTDLALNFCEKIDLVHKDRNNFDNFYNIIYERVDVGLAYKAGYRKAKEE